MPKNANQSVLADVFVERINQEFGLPISIVSGRESISNSKWWTSFYIRLGIHYRLGVTFHPQIDGQTERLNQVLEQYVRNYYGH